jgi:hypothetical protein
MLIEELTSFAQWRARYFPQSSGSIALFAAEDPGGLGIPNLQRYAYGLDALAPDRTRLPRPLLRDGFLTVDLWQRPDATDVAYGLSLSSNLFQWDASPTAWQPLLPSPVPDPNVLTFRASQPVTNTPQLFFKVKVDYIP